MKNIKYVTLVNPLFLGGKNHKEKVFNAGGVEIEYDETKDHVKIFYAGEVAQVKNYDSIVSAATKTPKPDTIVNPAPRKPIKAQASSPHDHVFAEGPGKTRD